MFPRICKAYRLYERTRGTSPLYFLSGKKESTKERPVCDMTRRHVVLRRRAMGAKQLLRNVEGMHSHGGPSLHRVARSRDQRWEREYARKTGGVLCIAMLAGYFGQ